jgi:transketolase
LLENLGSRQLSNDDLRKIKKLANLARGDIIKMTTLAQSGHPGGSMSSIDIYLVLYSLANLSPKDPRHPDRDRVVVSHGHTSPGVYAALGRLGFFDIDEVIATFRLVGSQFEGHIERHVPGVEWSTGNLGQGLSAACGFAISAHLLQKNFHVFAAMSDAEQNKGQVAEARRFAYKYKLNNLTVIIDYNDRQISGRVRDIMPIHIKEDYEADGWQTLEVNGHDMEAIYHALTQAIVDDQPTVIIAHTVMGKGVSFMEGNEAYHGRALTEDEYKKALEELGIEDDLQKYQLKRRKFQAKNHKASETPNSCPYLNVGKPRLYETNAKTDNRSAFGNALLDIGKLNNLHTSTPVVAFDCDLASSVKTSKFAEEFPEHFFQAGVQEHNTATVAGALSTQGVVVFFADFGVFGLDETYNQHRLNDINQTNLKVVVTHCGVDVGPDGKTHHCLDYLALPRNLYSFKAIIPADPNQTDRAVRFAASNPGNFTICMGRSKLPIITDEAGQPFFGNGYEFHYGKADIIRDGEQAAIITMGSMVHRAVEAFEKLKKAGCLVSIINMACPLHPDLEAIKKAVKTGLIVTYEDHNVHSGLGALVAQVIAENGWSVRFKKLGVPHYAPSGESKDLFKFFQLDADALAQTVLEEIQKK